MVGADLSGIELRMLAHYLARYDGGRYAKILLEDDIHQVNADRIGISRRAVKTVTYAFLYGAGDQKIGLSYDPQLSASSAKRKGKEIKEAFVSAIDGLAELLAAIKKASDRGYVKAIDGRKVILDSSHKALNYCLQASAGVIAKRWMVINQNNVQKLNLCCSQLGFIHDELQFECDPQHASDLCSSLVYSALEAGEYYNLRIENRQTTWLHLGNSLEDTLPATNAIMGSKNTTKSRNQLQKTRQGSRTTHANLTTRRKNPEDKGK